MISREHLKDYYVLWNIWKDMFSFTKTNIKDHNLGPVFPIYSFSIVYQLTTPVLRTFNI